MGRTACTESQCLYKGDLYSYRKGILGVELDIGLRFFFWRKCTKKIKFHHLFKISVNVILYEVSETWSKIYSVLHVNFPLFLSHIKGIWTFPICCRKFSGCRISWKSVQWELICFIRTDRQTDTMKPVFGFTQFFENKVKVELNLEQATKAQRCSRGIALLFL